MEDEKTQLIEDKRSHSRRTFTDITLTLLARHIITPLIMLPILAVICQRSHLEVFKDPVFILSATLIVGAPPAITLAQMTSKANMDFFDEMVSKLLLWSYALAT
jgi:predicted permease